jgi:hypothetical protein
MTATPEEFQSILTSLALAENMGDVNDVLPRLCRLLNLPEPEWSDDLMRFVMAWEEPDGD